MGWNKERSSEMPAASVVSDDECPGSAASGNPRFDGATDSETDSDSQFDSSDSEHDLEANATIKDVEGRPNEQGRFASKAKAWASTRKAKAALVALGCVAVIGVVAGAGRGGSEPPTLVVDPEWGNDVYSFSASSFGVMAKLDRYPGWEGEYPMGMVTLKPDNVLSWDLYGFEASAQGGIHIHVGATCEESGGHWFQGDTDGWTETKWSSDAQGASTGNFDVDQVAGGYPYADNVEHALVVHNAEGVRVACGVLTALTTETAKVEAKMARYPELDAAIAAPTGYVQLSPSNVMTWQLSNLEAGVEGGVHVHEGLTCEESGGHWFTGEVDNWIGIKYTSDDKGEAKGEVDLAAIAGMYGFKDNVDHAVVVHSAAGVRVACGVLLAKPVPDEEDGEDNDDDDDDDDKTAEPEDEPQVHLEEDDIQYYSVKGRFRRYPGLSDEYQHPKGNVWLDANNILSYGIHDLESDVQGGMHIHAGKTCEEAGPHHWDESAGPDPWVDTKYSSNAEGHAWGKMDVDDLVHAFPFTANLDRTVVLHASDGTRVACAELRAREDYGVKAIMGQYPGGPEDHPTGRVVLDSANVLTFQLRNLEAVAQGGIHVHEGTSCDLSQGHHYDKTQADGWTETTWRSNEQGAARGMIDVSSIAGGLGYERNVNRVVVLHNSEGVRVACGKLQPYVFSPTLVDDGVEDPEYDFSVSNRFRRYPGFKGKDVPRGRAYLDSGNILSFEMDNLPKNKAGGIHIHVGTNCKEAGGHFYMGEDDGWTTTQWVSTSAGTARGVIDVSTVAGAYPFASSLNRVVVVHDDKGERVACTKLRTRAGFGLRGELDVYPGRAEADGFAKGSVFLSRDNLFSYSLRDLAPSASGGIHIHAAMGPNACAEDAGPHWWVDGSPDPWNVIQYSSTDKGTARGVIDLDQIAGAYSFADNVAHAVVVHDPSGVRISCAVLDDFVVDAADEVEEAFDAAIELEEGEEYDEDMHYCDSAVAHAPLRKYPGTETEDRIPRGRVRLNSDNVLSFRMWSLDGSSTGGIHIHEGASCDQAGAHWWQQPGADPWTVTQWVSDERGRAEGFIDVDSLANHYPFASNLQKTVVVHGPSGDRVACAEIDLNRNYGVKGIMRPYPGLSADVQAPEGAVFLSNDNTLYYKLKGGDAATLHIHEGTTCEESGGHWFTEGAADFWNDVSIALDEDGRASGSLPLAGQEGAYSFHDNAYHAVVVHNSEGARVACTTLKTFKRRVRIRRGEADL